MKRMSKRRCGRCTRRSLSRRIRRSSTLRHDPSPLTLRSTILMRILVLGVGKTGKLVAEVAGARGHSVDVLHAKENKAAAALTAPFVAGFDVVTDFTTPEAVISNMRACLANGAKMVVGTTGWYDRLQRAKDAAERRGA